MLAILSRLSGCPPARARRIASLSVVSAELSPLRFFARRSSRRTCLALRARRSLLISRTLLTGSDIAGPAVQSRFASSAFISEGRLP